MSDLDQDKHREIENELFKIHEKNQDTFLSIELMPKSFKML